jgi:hypothetical protein
MPDNTQFRERTLLARQRSSLALVLIAALLLTHSHALLAVATALLVAAGGLGARSPRTLAAATGLAAACAVVVTIV